MGQDKEWMRLRDLLREGSYQPRQVVLTSGEESNFYIDAKLTSLLPEGAYLIGRLFLRMLRSDGPLVEAVGGMTLGADPLVTAVSVVSHIEGYPLPGFIIRKEPKGHGMMRWIEGAKNLPKGAHVAILEDVVTTGGTTLRAIERTTSEGFEVARGLALVDRQEGGGERIGEAGFRLEPLYVRSQLDAAE